MLSYLGWFNGLTTLGIFLFSGIFGLFVFYKSRKSKTKVLTIAGLMIVFCGLMYLGPLSDFLSILLRGNNLDNSRGLYAILSYTWVGPLVVIAIYIGAELIFPKIKWYIVTVYAILLIIFELFIWIDTMNSFNFIYPTNPGEDMIDSTFYRTHPTFILITIFIVSALILNGFGFLIRSIQSTGIIRKKFLYLSIGFITFPIFAAIDALSAPGIMLFIVRIFQNGSPILFYLGLKEEREKFEILNLEKEEDDKKIEISLTEMLSQVKPAIISSSEISFYREIKVCLVCKGKATGFNVYLCPNCDALYCQNCALALAESENFCWSCNGPIDESKPIKPYSEDEKRSDGKLHKNFKKKEHKEASF